MRKQSKTSWEPSAAWYDKIVGQKGHYYHEHVIFPNIKKLLKTIWKKEKIKVLDLACGQGVFSRQIPISWKYTGIDLSPSLIKLAKKNALPNHLFFAQDITESLVVKDKDFDLVTIILALQNLKEPQKALHNAASHLKKGGKLLCVLNHPCFRIPRLSHWGIDEKKSLQYRRIDSYLSSQKIPIQMHPGKEEKEVTWSFHHSLTSLFSMLADSGFATLEVQEWVSDKKSTGSKKKMEDRARSQFPLFLTLLCEKRPL